jgi:mercuric ion transport protein
MGKQKASCVMNTEEKTTTASLWGGFGLALLGTTCCALPIALVAVGMGSVVASLASIIPGLAWLSQYKAVTFSVTGVVLAYSGWRLRKAHSCDLAFTKRLKWQRRILMASTLILTVSVLAAYALLPMTLWMDGT